MMYKYPVLENEEFAAYQCHSIVRSITSIRLVWGRRWFNRRRLYRDVRLSLGIVLTRIGRVIRSWVCRVFGSRMRISRTIRSRMRRGLCNSRIMVVSASRMLLGSCVMSPVGMVWSSIRVMRIVGSIWMARSIGVVRGISARRVRTMSLRVVLVNVRASRGRCSCGGSCCGSRRSFCGPVIRNLLPCSLVFWTCKKANI